MPLRDYTQEFDPAVLQALIYDSSQDTPEKLRAKAAALRGDPSKYGNDMQYGLAGTMLRGPTAERMSKTLYGQGAAGKRGYEDELSSQSNAARANAEEARKGGLVMAMGNIKDKRAAAAQAAKDAEAERRWNAEFGLKQRAEGRMSADSAARLEIARANAGRVAAATTAAQEAKGVAAGLKTRAEQQGVQKGLDTGERNLTLINDMLEHPGRKAATGASGVIASHLPFTDARAFQAKHNQLMGGAFLEAFQTLKGGGQITEVEGKKATDAITMLNTPGLSEADYEQGLRELQEVVQLGVTRAKQQGYDIGMFKDGLPGAPSGDPRQQQPQFGMPAPTVDVDKYF
jgi:hypothetical protein